MNKTNEEKLKVLMQVEPDHIIEPEDDFFILGLLELHELIDKDMNLTLAGEKAYEEMMRENNF